MSVEKTGTIIGSFNHNNRESRISNNRESRISNMPVEVQSEERRQVTAKVEVMDDPQISEIASLEELQNSFDPKAVEDSFIGYFPP